MFSFLEAAGPRGQNGPLNAAKRFLDGNRGRKVFDLSMSKDILQFLIKIRLCFAEILLELLEGD